MKEQATKYEVKVFNGAFPLTFKAANIAQVYECLTTFDNSYDVGLDRNYLIMKLAELESGNGFKGFKDGTNSWVVEIVAE